MISASIVPDLVTTTTASNIPDPATTTIEMHIVEASTTEKDTVSHYSSDNNGIGG